MRKFFAYSLIILLAGVLTAAGVGALVYNSQTLDESKLSARSHPLLIFDNDGEAIPGTAPVQNTSVTDLPDHVKWAFICVEDKDFYKHKGINYNRIAKAAYKNANARETKEGASTISQQLIKNTHLTHEKTLKRKIREAALAHKLEKKYSKDQILQMYLDAVYFGNGITGLEHASRFYYDKPANQLTIRESAALAGILKSPARFDPITRTQNFTDRTNYVLGMMHTQGRISKDQHDTARTEQIVISGRRPRNDASSYRAAAISQAVGVSGKSAAELTTGKYKIFTFFDAGVQNAINETLKNPDYTVKNMSDNPADMCIIAATPQGEVTALHTNNHALLSGKRNFASAMKPLVVYAPAIELGVVTPDTIIMDEPYTAGDFHPKNHDNKFRGEVTVRESLAHSHNVPAVKVLDYTRLPRAVNVAQGLGLTLEDENMTLALGSTRQGTTFWELLGGYCALANEGLKTTPSLVKRIENRDGKTVWQYTDPYIRALSEDTCLTVTDMLTTAVKEGTAKKLASLDFDIAAKTGTTERGAVASEARQSPSQDNAKTTNTDALIMSYTPSNVLLTWHGNTSMKPEDDLPGGIVGGGVTSFIARDIMRAITADNLQFNKPTQSNIAAPDANNSPSQGEGVARVQARDGVGKITLDAKIGHTGAPELRFNTRAEQKYQIHRKVDGTTSLLEVIKNYQGEYTYTDKTAASGKMIEYWVTSGDVKSNTVKILISKPINKNAQPNKRPGGKHWFF